MAELARGTVFDRPWGRTIGALGLRGLSGQLTLVAFDGKRYEMAFSHGAVVGASSAIASDAAVRVALTGGLISTTQVAELMRKAASQPDRDEVEVIADHLRLGFDQAMRLRRRTIAQRAARSFSVDKGEFVVTDEITLPTVAGSELDIRSIIYLGARQNLTEARLASELGLFGTWFRLKPEAFEDLPQFGFTDAERPIIDALLNGASLGDLEAIVGIDVRAVRATLYALCAANACNVEQTRGQTTKPPPPTMRGSDPGVRRSSASSQPPASQPPAPQPAAPPRSNRPTQQPLVAYRPGVRRSGGTAPPPNTTQTVVDANRPMGAAGNTMPPPHARRATTTPPVGHGIVDPHTQSNPGFSRAHAEPDFESESGVGRVGPTNSGSNPGLTHPGGSNPGLGRAGSGSNPGVPRTITPTAAPRTTAPTAAPRTTTPTAPRTTTPTAAPRTTASTTAPRTTTPTTAPRTATPTTSPSTAPRTGAQTTSPRSTTAPPRASTATTSPVASRTMTGARPASPTKLPGMQAPDVQALISARASQIEQGADHYALLGVAPTSSPDEIRKTYFNLARQLHPDRLAALGIADDGHVAHKVFAQLNTAFSTLSDPKRRAEYDQLLGRGGEGAMRDEQQRAEEMAMRIFQAEEAYKKGELALKRDDLGNAIAELERAIALNPDEPDFSALHAWAMFCATPDKTTIARHTKATLEKAIQKSPRAINPRFYLGRVHRMLGNDKEALQLFRDVLLDKPHHFEAQGEVRAIEARLSSNNPPKGGGGLFGRKR